MLYTPCITTGPDKILAHARMAVEAGANGVMFVFIGAGFESLRIVAESDVNVPIYAHCAGKEHWARVPDQGIDQRVVAKFARLMGGDYFRIGALGGYFAKDDVGEAAVLRPALDRADGEDQGRRARRFGRAGPVATSRTISVTSAPARCSWRERESPSIPTASPAGSRPCAKPPKPQ